MKFLNKLFNRSVGYKPISQQDDDNQIELELPTHDLEALLNEDNGEPIEQSLGRFSVLADEMILMILEYLTQYDVVHFGKTCKRGQQIHSDETIWQRLYHDNLFDYAFPANKTIHHSEYKQLALKLKADIATSNLNPQLKQFLQRRPVIANIESFKLPAKLSIQDLITPFKGRPALLGFSRNQICLNSIYLSLKSPMQTKSINSECDDALLAILCNKLSELKKYFNPRNEHKYSQVNKNRFLLYACWLGYAKIAEYLIVTGNISSNTEFNNLTMLDLALIERQYDVAKVLLTYGAPKDQTTAKESFLLNGVIRAHDTIGLKLLLDAGADPKAKDFNQLTPMQMALNTNASPVIFALLFEKNNFTFAIDDLTRLLACPNSINNLNSVVFDNHHKENIYQRAIYILQLGFNTNISDVIFDNLMATIRLVKRLATHGVILNHVNYEGIYEQCYFLNDRSAIARAMLLSGIPFDQETNFDPAAQMIIQNFDLYDEIREIHDTHLPFNLLVAVCKILIMNASLDRPSINLLLSDIRDYLLSGTAATPEFHELPYILTLHHSNEEILLDVLLTLGCKIDGQDRIWSIVSLAADHSPTQYILKLIKHGGAVDKQSIEKLIHFPEFFAQLFAINESILPDLISLILPCSIEQTLTPGHYHNINLIYDYLAKCPLNNKIPAVEYIIAIHSMIFRTELRNSQKLAGLMTQLAVRYNKNDNADLERLLLHLIKSAWNTFKELQKLLNIIPSYDLALSQAVRSNSPLFMIDYLILKNADPTWIDAKGWTAIEYAADREDTRLVAHLMQNSIRPSHLGKNVIATMVSAVDIISNSNIGFWTQEENTQVHFSLDNSSSSEANQYEPRNK